MKLVFILTFILSLSTFAVDMAEPNAIDWVVLVNKENKLNSISKAELKRLFLKQQLFWEDGKKVVPITFDKDNIRFEVFTNEFLNLTKAQYDRFWIEQKFVSKQQPPKSVQQRLIPQMGSIYKGAISVVPKSVWDKAKNKSKLKRIKVE